MALFVDGNINRLQDLERHESGLLDMTSSEQIDVSAKMGLAQDLIAAELLTFLLERNSRTTDWLYLWGSRRQKDVSDVVLTEPLKRWHALRSIELIYDNAYSNQLNDRYKAKRDQFYLQALRASGVLFRIGIGIVCNPVRRPEAPLLMSVEGGLMSATYYVRTSWVNFSGQEGEASVPVSLTTADGTLLVVAPPPIPEDATGWNVYVGQSPESVALQNPLPLTGDSTWMIPFTGLRLGRVASTGQRPESFVVRHQAMLRG